MNYLAHLYFSDPTPLAWAGSLMGDFFKGSDFSGMPPSLVRHIRLHRFLDSYTTKDASFRRSCMRLDPALRFSRAIIIDVFYDHFLACRWRDFAEGDLSTFSASVYAALRSNEDILSLGLRQQLPRMIEYDWLTSYGQPEIVARVLQRLEERLRGKFPLSQAYAALEPQREVLLDDFYHFMQAAGGAISRWKKANPAKSQVSSLCDVRD
jgi:acyl carrier protein phosphodiesterase